MPETETHKELYARVSALESAKAVTDERFNQVMRALEDIKKVIENALVDIKAGYVTKDELKAVIADGKYKKLWGGIVGAIVTFVVLALLGQIPTLN